MFISGIQKYEQKLITTILILLALSFLVSLYITLSLDRRSEVVTAVPSLQNSSVIIKKSSDKLNEIIPPVHLYYYSWYGNQELDGKFWHWSHEILDDRKLQYDAMKNDIGSSYYPLLGLYSSRDPQVVQTHMQWIQRAGISVIVLSWWGENKNDNQISSNTGFSDSTVQLIMNLAARHNIFVCFHIEPYAGRTAKSVGQNIRYLIDKYGNHPAFYYYRDSKSLEARPFFYIYDSYKIPSHEWASVLGPGGILRQMPRKYSSSIVTGLLVERQHIHQLVRSHFDAWYTYFSVDGFVWGSTQSNWNFILTQAEKYSKLFIPSIGPGYDDLRIRPWNTRNFRSRQKGEYYNRSWNNALKVYLNSVKLSNTSVLIGITSFNEWHEGTNIEPVSTGQDAPNLTSSLTDNTKYFALITDQSAKSERKEHVESIQKDTAFTFSDYSPHDSFYYLDITHHFIDEFLS